MSSFKPLPPAQGSARCDGCGTVHAIDALDWIEDAAQRLTAGEEVPAGQCPDTECGACCFVVETPVFRCGDCGTEYAEQFSGMVCGVCKRGIVNEA